MFTRATRHFYQHVRWLPALAALLGALPALARVGGGEHYTSSNSNNSSGGGDVDIGLLFDLIWLVFAHPAIGVPVLIILGIFAWYRYRTTGDTSTSKAVAQAEAQARTAVSAQAVTGWVAALKAKDQAFDLLHLFDNTRRLFVDLQQAWFKRDLTPMRRFLSDATFQRLSVQLKLLSDQGVRDAVTDVQVNDLQIIGLEQNQWFDALHVRVKAQARDDDAPANATEEQALALAKKAPLEPFVEVWTLLRKPGAQTRTTHELVSGNCPNCGAPFAGGAANRCDHCGAVVNSGNYDWVLAEITQGSEYVRGEHAVEGLSKARQTDPALNTEALEDRASLCFWKWVEAQSSGDARRASKVASQPLVDRLTAELEALMAQGRRKVFLECAVGSVATRLFEAGAGVDLAHVEVRWSARMGIGPMGEKAPSLPTVPHRWVFTLERKAGATTLTDNGLATARCPNCGAPLTDNGTPACEYCGQVLSSGERDWVLSDAQGWEAWSARHSDGGARAPTGKTRADQVPSREERERLLYMMAALAAADGVVDARERELLTMCATRWGIDFANVELALSAGPALFERLVLKGSAEAESFLAELVQMALVDGKVDRRERALLQAAAEHLGVLDRLPMMLGR